MSHQKLPNYLRTHRKRAGLSQKELAFLLGCKSGAKASRYERFARQPTIQTAFACAFIFGSPARELFAGIAQSVERDTLRRVRLLTLKLKQAKPQRATIRKVEFLQALTDRSRNNPVHKA